MKKLLFSTSLVVVPLLLSISMLLVINRHGDSATYTQNLFEVGNDYRLKFVDSTDVELGLGMTNKVILPVDIFKVCEEDSKIKLTTAENAVILAPITCEVLETNRENAEIKLRSGKVLVVLDGVISGVARGNKLSCGDVIGTVKGNTCLIEVYWGSKKLSLEEIKALI